MLSDRIEGKWIDAFCEVFERCAVKPGDTAQIWLGGIGTLTNPVRSR